MEQNLANIQKLYYCDKLSNNCSCGNIATRQIKMVNKRWKNNPDSCPTKIMGYRCEEHSFKPTVNYFVGESNELDQEYAFTKINQFLKSLINKKIISTHHGKRPLIVKYLGKNCGIMCLNEFTKKWKFVYYNQIKQVL